MPDQPQNPTVIPPAQSPPPADIEAGKPAPNPGPVNPAPAAETPAPAAAQSASWQNAGGQVEPVPLPKVTDVETPSIGTEGSEGKPAFAEATAGKEGQEAGKPAEPNPLFEKPEVVGPGAKSEQRIENSEQRKLPKGVIAGIAALVFLVAGGLVGGNYLVKQKQEVTTLAVEGSCSSPLNEGEKCGGSSSCSQSEPGFGCSTGLYCDSDRGDTCQQVGRIVQGSGKAKVIMPESAVEVSNLSCGQEYIINSGIDVTHDTNYGQMWDHRIWINHQGSNAGQERGLIHWSSNGNNLQGTKIGCECGNAGQCRGGGGYASLESGGDYIELTRCTAWTNSMTDPDSQGYPNHGVNFFFKPTNKWGTDGPLIDNDISTYGENLYGEVHNWTNSDLNFSINCASGAAPTPTTIQSSPTPTSIPPTATETPVTISANCESLAGQVSGGAGGWVNKTDAEFVAAVRPGDRVRFVCTGHKTQGNFTKSAFFINNVLHVDDVVKLNDTQFAVEYTIGAAGALKVESVLLHDSKGWVD